jgi:hypothetical protein
MASSSKIVEKRLVELEAHLDSELPILKGIVDTFRDLDKVGYRMGLLTKDDSFAVHIPWWPLISVLGVFSAGKSSFINYLLDLGLQDTGNQAVDDKFTVISYSHEDKVNILPGLALDADPRFPFYQISHEIENVSKGEGERINTYLQLKTCPSEILKGRVIIDSPGFDADEQRRSVLRITDHIIDLSDLVLVFFDARHPEPGAMQDTLEHLVKKTLVRPDSTKFLFILNQIDTAAKEDNPESVIGAWQRALASAGMVGGRFYTIYNPNINVEIEDPAQKSRFEHKRDIDLDEIKRRIDQVEVERTYRVVGELEKISRSFSEKVVPQITERLRSWRRQVLFFDGIIFSILFILLGSLFSLTGVPEWLKNPQIGGGFFAVLVAVMMTIHFKIRNTFSKRIQKSIEVSIHDVMERNMMVNAFKKNTRPWRSVFHTTPVGWGMFSKKQVTRVLEGCDDYIQVLNNQFANPAGKGDDEATVSATAEVSAETKTAATT